MALCPLKCLWSHLVSWCIITKHSVNETGAFAVHCDKSVYFAVHFLTFFSSPNDSNYKIVTLFAAVSVCDLHFDDVPLFEFIVLCWSTLYSFTCQVRVTISVRVFVVVFMWCLWSSHQLPLFSLSLSLSLPPPPPSLTVIGILYLSLITLSKSVYKNYIYILLSFLFSYFIVLHMNYPFGVWQLPADKRLQAQSTGPVRCDSEWKAGGACGAAGWEHSQCLGPRPHQEWLDLWSLWSGYHATVCVCVHFFQLSSLNLTIRSYLP